MKSKEELSALKEEVETLSSKLAELTEEELAQVTGGTAPHGWLDVGASAYTSDVQEDAAKACFSGTVRFP